MEPCMTSLSGKVYVRAPEAAGHGCLGSCCWLRSHLVHLHWQACRTGPRIRRSSRCGMASVPRAHGSSGLQWAVLLPRIDGRQRCRASCKTTPDTQLQRTVERVRQCGLVQSDASLSSVPSYQQPACSAPSKDGCSMLRNGCGLLACWRPLKPRMACASRQAQFNRVREPA